MWTMGWKPKAEKLKMVILSGAHSVAKELPAGLERILEIMRHAVESGDASGLMAKVDDVPKDPTLNALGAGEDSRLGTSRRRCIARTANSGGW